MDSSIIVSIFVAVFASGGFWAFLTSVFQSKDKRREEENKQMRLQSKILIGLGHDRIVALGAFYIERGYITPDEYENLRDYLYQPYKELGGNGTAEKIMQDVSKLPIREHHEHLDCVEGGV